MEVEQDKIGSGSSFDRHDTVLERGFDLSLGVVSSEESTEVHKEKVRIPNWICSKGAGSHWERTAMTL